MHGCAVRMVTNESVPFLSMLDMMSCFLCLVLLTAATPLDKTDPFYP